MFIPGRPADVRNSQWYCGQFTWQSASRISHEPLYHANCYRNQSALMILETSVSVKAAAPCSNLPLAGLLLGYISLWRRVGAKHSATVRCRERKHCPNASPLRHVRVAPKLKRILLLSRKHGRFILSKQQSHFTKHQKFAEINTIHVDMCGFM